MARNTKRGERHVRLHKWEADLPAWQTLSPAARALLIEMRLLYNPTNGNRVFMSLREIQTRVNVGRRVAEQARDELLARGWIRLIEPGGFSRKARHAPVYALEHLPLHDGDGATPPKTFARWQP